MYAILSNIHVEPTSKQKLMTMFELTENDIKQIYKLLFKTTKNCKSIFLAIYGYSIFETSLLNFSEYFLSKR
jgi:hypothetical protein